LPALEALHKSWTKRAERAKYFDFVPALNAGLAKIAEYYDRTADSNAYTFAMCKCSTTSLCPLNNPDASLVLDPSQKTEHIRKYWGQEKLEDILKEAEETVSVVSNIQVLQCALTILQYKQRYLEMYSNSSTPAPAWRTGKSAIRKVGILIRELSDDDDDSSDPGIETHTSSITSSEPSAPWRKDFFGYLNSTDQLGNMTIVEWWGVRLSHIHALFYFLTYRLVQYDSL
jgi:hypothetical protein